MTDADPNIPQSGDRHDQPPRKAPTDEELRLELVELGRRLRGPELHGETMAERVLTRILADAVPTPVPEPPGRAERLRACLGRRRRAVTAVLCGLLAVTAATEPVRTPVIDWFGFDVGGVSVRPATRSPSPDAASGAGSGCAGLLAVAEATRLAGFDPVVPRDLGPPAAASVTVHPPGHRTVLTLCWTHGRDGTVRLEQFPASIDPLFRKTARALYEPVRADGVNGLWFPQAESLELRLVGEDGRGYRRHIRPAGPTLVWQVPGRTLRLEGAATRRRAVEIARGTDGSGASAHTGPSRSRRGAP